MSAETSIGAPGEVRMVRHGKIDLALHTLRAGGTGRPLLLLHGLGEQSPAEVPDSIAGWPGPIAALDFTGHGASTVPRGGGYTAEILLADADVALAALTDGDESATITVLGRGLGAYIALQLAGARPARVHGAVLADGPGLFGGPTTVTSQSFFLLDTDGSAPDPYALWELGRDLRPPDYATSFVRLANEGSPLEEPMTVSAIIRPEWLEAVARELGVAQAPVADALASYA